jgi:small-conductance mechanosensitive channel
MKLTRTHLKQLILEEMKLMKENEQGQEQGQEQEDPKVMELKQSLIDAAKNMSGIQTNEAGIVDFLVNLINLAKTANLKQSTFLKYLELVKKEAEKIAK